MSAQIDILAHRIASEFVRRERRGVHILGGNSLYNAVREAAIAALEADPSCNCKPYHRVDCPACGEDNRRDATDRAAVSRAADPTCADCGHPRSDHLHGRCDHDVDGDWDGERMVRIPGCDCEGYYPTETASASTSASAASSSATSPPSDSDMDSPHAQPS